uniref:(northern house mosquito) hypothetical protein n=1 Tax=Culex pipiens TaxID=7175 RepID=A0A8D8J6V9_CULPI
MYFIGVAPFTTASNIRKFQNSNIRRVLQKSDQNRPLERTPPNPKLDQPRPERRPPAAHPNHRDLFEGDLADGQQCRIGCVIDVHGKRPGKGDRELGAQYGSGSREFPPAAANAAHLQQLTGGQMREDLGQCLRR